MATTLTHSHTTLGARMVTQPRPSTGELAKDLKWICSTLYDELTPRIVAREGCAKESIHIAAGIIHWSRDRKTMTVEGVNGRNMNPNTATDIEQIYRQHSANVEDVDLPRVIEFTNCASEYGCSSISGLVGIVFPLKENVEGILFVAKDTPLQNIDKDDVFSSIGTSIGDLVMQFAHKENLNDNETEMLLVNTMLFALEQRDPDGYNHNIVVAQIAEHLGMALGLDDEELKTLKGGALLHDIGKLAIPLSILHKKGELTDDEWKIMRQHSDYGADILERYPLLRRYSQVVRELHEAIDGLGYPKGLKGAEINLLSRVAAVADATSALGQNRSYRDAFSLKEIVNILRIDALGFTHFVYDYEIVRLATHLIETSFYFRNIIRSVNSKKKLHFSL